MQYELKNVSKRAPTWEYNGIQVRANTKSEARAWLKHGLGIAPFPLPPGARIVKLS